MQLKYITETSEGQGNISSNFEYEIKWNLTSHSKYNKQNILTSVSCLKQ